MKKPTDDLKLVPDTTANVIIKRGTEEPVVIEDCVVYSKFLDDDEKVIITVDKPGITIQLTFKKSKD